MISILGVLIVGKLSLMAGVPPKEVQQFAVSATYLMGASLILTGLLQLLFTRFVADRLFENKREVVIANLLGVLSLVTVVSGVSGAFIVTLAFSQPLLYRLLMLVCFVALCDLWIVVVLLSGLKAYRMVLIVLFIGYSMSIGISYLLHPFGLVGLLGGFTLAQAVMFFLLLALVIRNYKADRLISFAFLRSDQSYYTLMFTGLFNNVAIWADKFIFWMNPNTSEQIIGPLRASLIYDLPIFLAYLSIIPGMGVFLMRMETDFAERYEEFFDSVREGGSLQQIYLLKDRMVFSLRQGIYEIFKVQGLTVLGLILAGPSILRFFGISHLYIQLFNIDLVAVGMQMVLMGVLNAIFYFDYRNIALILNLMFATLNILLTMLTMVMGYNFYGYGYALATSITTFVGLMALLHKMDRLEYETFMLQE